MRHTWTDAQIETLKGMWSRWTAEEIAAELGEGFTGHAVIGKADRLRLPRKKSAGHRARAA